MTPLTAVPPDDTPSLSSPLPSPSSFSSSTSPRSANRLFLPKIFCTTGMQYANVFPLPVRALTSRSLPDVIA
eukprot:CAMPEP_0196146408 /NCGR_PEP_ID=MMETSP0910-20130528/22960_1 /TAXON_ID=49265 /ORGANISM="Thalassiosira rotula, Strain GSO102" /LENGTH=71 /DNA_ID=CAMNT_0041408597 /DNA_START=72 /DNA_END=283 /DNA_ORIENTATION=+